LEPDFYSDAARLRLDTSRAAIGLGEDDQPNALQTRLVIAATKGGIQDLWGVGRNGIAG